MNKLHIVRRAVVATAISGFLGLSSGAYAATVQYNDLANFTAAANPLILTNFSGEATGAFANRNFGDFSISESSANNSLSVVDIDPGPGIDEEIQFQTGSGNDLFTISFAVPVNAIGFDFNNTDTIPSGGEFLLTTVGGTTTTYSIGGPHTFGFFGLVTDGAISTLELRSNDAMGALGSTFLDNFRYSVVPLPAAAWLLLSGLIGFVTVGRRKNAV